MKIDPALLGKATMYNWTKDYLFQVLTEGKNAPISDPKVALAFRTIDRADFVPPKEQTKAYQDLDVDIGYGETLTRPTILAQMAELMKIVPGEGKYLDIGSGTGFFGLVMGYLAGPEAEVLSLERVQWLWEASRENDKKYENIKNVKFLYRDGAEGLPQEAPFKGIHASIAYDEIPHALKMQLYIGGGRLVAPTNDYNVRVIIRHGMDEFEEEIVPGFVFKKGQEGLA